MIQIIYTLVVTHITIVCVTLFLHRGQAHRAIEFHPILSHAMRFWLWLTTGMNTQEWVAVHRKHHRFVDRAGDPHSPHIFGILSIVFGGVVKYNQAAQDKKMLAMYGRGTPNDWLEKHLYSHDKLGLTLMLMLDILFFSYWGIVIWLVQMLWIPFWAAGVINGIGHWWGYRNSRTKDQSRNIVPWGIVVGGEELHNNHHYKPSSAKLSIKWYEFDLGYLYLKLFTWLRLAKIK